MSTGPIDRRRLMAALAAAVLPLAALAPAARSAGEAEGEAPADPLAEHLWLHRLVIVFADSERDPRYKRQMELLARDPDGLAERDIVVMTDTDPAARSPLRERFRPHGFMLVIVDKDGEILIRKPLPWTVREIGRLIDKTPLRQQEIEERLLEGAGG